MKPTVSVIAERPPVETEARKPLSRWGFAELFLSHFGRCKECRARLSKGYCCDDHIIPLVCGGTNAIENRQLLCPPCHSRKTDETDKADAARIKRRNRQATEGRGRKPKGKSLKSRGFGKTLRRKFNGTVERTER